MRRAELLAGVLLVALVGCAKSVIPEYEARRAEALAPPPDVPSRWHGDSIVLLKSGAVDELITDGLQTRRTFTRKVEIAGARHHVSPSLKIRQLDLLDGGSCESCFTFRAQLEGTFGWQLGASSGRVPMKGDVTFEVSFEARQDGEDWVVRAQPKRVIKADLQVSGKTYRKIKVVAQSALDNWASEHIFDEFKPIVLTRFRADRLPLVAIRPVRDEAGLRLDLLTAARVHEQVPPPSVKEGEDWALNVSQQALLHEARRAAFLHGPVSHDVVLEPRAIDIADGTFTMDLRLWRIKGKGWWRDVRIHGAHLRTPKGIELRAIDVVERGKSKGAAMVDPLAALAEGRILRAVEDSVQRVLPGDESAKVGEHTVHAEVTRLTGHSRVLFLGGRMTVGAKKEAGANRGTSRPVGGNR